MSKKFKVTLSKTEARGRKITQYIVNGQVIGKYEQYSEHFCSIKNGSPSNIRDTVKKASSISWYAAVIREITGNTSFSSIRRNATTILRDGYPDTTWGDKGPSAPSKKLIEETLESLATNL